MPSPAALAHEVLYEPTARERARGPDGRVGVVAHVFYPDLADELAAYLRNVPWPFTLLASTTTEDGAAAVVRAFEPLARVARLVVRVVPNRGRDIAPFLVGLADEVRALDYVCHVHTKRSLHTGRSQDAWRRHLLDALLGSEPRVRAVIAQLRADPGVGVVYPAPASILPYWSLTWLSNRAPAEALLARMGAPLDDATYLDFPAGSMFWARTAALRPLLDLGLRLEDFPPEQGQADGTIQHAIERCFVVAARVAGLSGREIVDAPGRHAFAGRSHRNAHQYLAMPVGERIAAAVPIVDVLAFGAGTLLLEAGSDVVRRAVEGRQAGVPCRRLDAGGARHDRATLRALLRPRVEVVAAARAARLAGRRVVVYSDGPLGSAELRAVLAGNGVDFWDALYVAGEHGIAARDGALFEEIARAEGVAPERLAIVGDDERADVQVPIARALGWPVHVMRPLALLDLTREGSALVGGARPSRWEDDLWVGLVAGELAAALDRDPAAALEGRLLSDPARFGYAALGPVLFLLAAAIARVAARGDVAAVELVGRSGWLLRAALERIAAHPRVTRALAPAGHLLASRRAAGFAAAESVEDVAAALADRFEGTIGALLEARLALPDPRPLREAIGTAALDRVVRLPEDAPALAGALRPAAPALLAAAAEERAAYRAYLGRRLRPGAVLVVAGGADAPAVLDALARLAGRSLPAYQAGPADVHPADAPALRSAADPSERARLLVEALLAAPEGPLLRFRRSGGGVRAVFGEAPPASAGALAEAHAGAHRFVRDVLDAAGDAALDLVLDRDRAWRLLGLVARGGVSAGALSALVATLPSEARAGIPRAGTDSAGPHASGRASASCNG